MVQTVSATRCPSWCAGDHLPTWRAHDHTVVTHRNPFGGELVEVVLSKHDDHDQPTITIALVSGHDEALTRLEPTTAAALADVLYAMGGAGLLASSLARAVELIDRDEDGGDDELPMAPMGDHTWPDGGPDEPPKPEPDVDPGIDDNDDDWTDDLDPDGPDEDLVGPIEPTTPDGGGQR